MTSLRLLVTLVVTAALLNAGLAPSRAQTDTAPLVVFVQGRVLDSAAMTNTGTSGVSELANIFRSLGARVEYTELTAPIPEQAQVVVLVGPTRGLGTIQVIYLWLHLARGNHALFAFDPEGAFTGFTNARARVTSSGLASLLEWDYGIAVQDTFLAEPWFSSDTISDLPRTAMLTYADGVTDPITDPVRRFGLPIWVWGTRHFAVEPFGIGSRGVPLLCSDSAFGETAPAIFRTEGGNPVDRLELNIGTDFLGRLNSAVRADSTTSGSRVVLLGDSEMLKNGFGLARSGALARHPGNMILAERLAAWLLEIPVEQWPALPAGFTWLAVDGDPSDWDALAAGLADDSGGEAAALSLPRGRAFTDGDYVYLLIQSATAPDPRAQIEMTFSAPEGSPQTATVAASRSQVVQRAPDGRETPVADAALAIGDAIELRLPARLISEGARLESLCLGLSGAPAGAAKECLGQPLDFTVTGTQAPFDFALTGHAMVSVVGDGVRIRRGPGTNTEQLGTVRDGTAFAALGRNDDTSWIRVQNARFDGWIVAYLLEPSGDLRTLPIVEAASGG